MADSEDSPRTGSKSPLLEAVVAGLIANALTASFVVLIAVLGGRLQVLKGVAVMALVGLGLGVLVVPVMAFRDLRRGTLMRELNAGRILVGSLFYAGMFLFLAYHAARYLLR